MTIANNQGVELDPLQREAVAWVGRLTSGKATTADAEALRRWCDQSAAHAAAFAAASRLWRDLEPAGRDLRHRGQAAWSQRRHPTINRRALLGAGLAAAAAGAYCVVRPPLGLWT
jgi:transmembrane sensor